MFINIPQDIGNFQVYPEAVYKAVITGAKYGLSQKQNPKLNVESTLQSQGPDETVKTVGKKVYDTWTFTDEAMGVVNGKFKGITGENLPIGQWSVDEFVNIVTNNIVNKEVLLQLVVKPGLDGNPRNDVKTYSKVV